MNDLELLRKYEPILWFTKGEVFFPSRVDDYISQCSLWVRPPNGESRMLVPAGHLNLDILATFTDAEPGHALYLRFVQRPLTGQEYRRWLISHARSPFKAPGRLARVGLGPRLIDALFSLSLLLRGTVPGGTAAAATQNYLNSAHGRCGHPYYARVVRSGGYVVLHYLYFYMMNDWRTSFDGANDHEADWEQVFVFLDENPGGEPIPAWLAVAAHDHYGDDLRRRWDDPELTMVGTHPVVFVAAGSHAGYFEPGEYLTPVELAFVKPALRMIHRAERLWRNTLGQGDPNWLARGLEGVFSVPFVDYARGDGDSIGPEQGTPWEPILISDDVPWVDNYRGLWGLDTRDPFAGESAPAGPKFNRNGTIRLSWYNPLGWAGLDKVAPPHAIVPTLCAHIERLELELSTVTADIQRLHAGLPALELETRALSQARHLAPLHRRRLGDLRSQDDELAQLHRRHVELCDTIEACQIYLRDAQLGELGDPKAHIRFRREPQTAEEIRKGTLAEVWSALSIGLLLLGVVGLVFFGVGNWLLTIGLILGTFILIEATFHRRLEKLLLNLTIVLAVVTAIVLAYEFLGYVILVSVAAIATLVIADNVRELRRR